MPDVTTFGATGRSGISLLRRVPGPYLKEYLAAKKIDLPGEVDWSGKPADLRKSLRAAIEAIAPPMRAMVRVDAVLVDGMADEAGQAALRSAANAEQQALLAEIESAHARALWMLVHHPMKFRRAEESAIFDRARNKNTWDAFVAPIDLTVSRDKVARRALADELAAIFRSEGKIKVRVEVFDRAREADSEDDAGLVQVVVLREGQTAAPTVFEDDDPDDDEPETTLLPHRPVAEIGFAYDPVSGVVEVVASGKERREKLVCSLARTLMGHDLDPERVPKHPYDLSVFLAEQEFPTDPEDRILWVKVVLVKFDHDDGRTIVTVESREANETIHATAERLFKNRNPFRGGYSIREVVVAVKFMPDGVNPRGRTVSAKLRHPNGCSLGETCAKERLIRRKYLPAWGVTSQLDVAS
jgi:hypothetical protein